jgi:hypothetical protein
MSLAHVGHHSRQISSSTTPVCTQVTPAFESVSLQVALAIKVANFLESIWGENPLQMVFQTTHCCFDPSTEKASESGSESFHTFRQSAF